MESEFAIADHARLVETVVTLDQGALMPEQRAVLAREAADLAERLAGLSQFDAAEKVSAIAAQSANRQKDPELKRDLEAFFAASQAQAATPGDAKEGDNA